MSDLRPQDTVPVRWAISPERRRRRRFGRAFLALPYLVSVLGVAALPRAPDPGEFFRPEDLTPDWWGALKTFALLGMMGTGLAWSVLRLRSAPPARNQGRLKVTDGALLFTGRGDPLRISLSDVRHARRFEGGAYAFELADDRTLTVRIDDPLEARRVWDRVLDDPERARRAPIASALSHVPVLPGILWFVFLMAWFTGFLTLRFAGSAVVEGRWVDLTAIPIGLGLQGLVSWLLRDREVRLGTDGLRIVGRLRDRFVPWRDITAVEGGDGHHAVLRRREGRAVRLLVRDASKGLPEELRRAFARYRDRAPAPNLEGLTRGDRPLAQWAEALRTGAGQYRDRALRFEELAAVVEDPEQSPEERLAAGLALSSREGGPDRLRIAAAAAADPDLEALFEAAAEGEVESASLERAHKRFEGG